MTWTRTRRRSGARRRTAHDWLRITAAAADLERRFADELAAGQPAHGEHARALAEEHRQHISATYYDCGYDTHRALADMYVGDERFTAHYERVAPGLAQYVRDAVHANADARG